MSVVMDAVMNHEVNYQKKPAYPPPARVQFSEHEQRLPWLSLLMDAYLITDQGLSEAIYREEKQGKNLACARGCASCCKSHETIPVYPLELMGMSWYATEVLEGELRERLKTQLRTLETLNSCPFLIDNACSIHPVRPRACRSFNVFNKQCEEREDAYHGHGGRRGLPHACVGIGAVLPGAQAARRGSGDGAVPR